MNIAGRYCFSPRGINGVSKFVLIEALGFWKPVCNFFIHKMNGVFFNLNLEVIPLTPSNIQAHLILLCFTRNVFFCLYFVFYKLKVCNPALSDDTFLAVFL